MTLDEELLIKAERAALPGHPAKISLPPRDGRSWNFPLRSRTLMVYAPGSDTVGFTNYHDGDPSHDHISEGHQYIDVRRDEIGEVDFDLANGQPFGITARARTIRLLGEARRHGKVELI